MLLLSSDYPLLRQKNNVKVTVYLHHLLFHINESSLFEKLVPFRSLTKVPNKEAETWFKSIRLELKASEVSFRI